MEKLEKDGLVGEIWGVEVNHTYYVGANGQPDVHACLKQGYWCWLNARQHPLDVIKYLRERIWKI